MSSRALVIGLDGASPHLLFERWREHLPTLASLLERGRYGVLRSCDPPITVPAWACMTSSRSPGALGLYGFRNRRDRSYDALAIADARAVRLPRVWDVLSERGRNVIVLGVPPTYPVSAVRGAMVACFAAPSGEASRSTYPTALKREIDALVGPYRADVGHFRTHEKERLLADVEDVTEKRFRIAEHLLATRPWDLFFMVEMGTDRLNHAFWHCLDGPEDGFGNAVLDYYRTLDERISRLLAFADEETAVLVVSDHGAKRLEGSVCANEWLRREGYLVLRTEPEAPTPLRSELVDWSRSAAWGEGGYYGRIWLNVRGREPRGTVAARDYERLRDEIAAGLEALGDAAGRPMGTVAHRPEELYREQDGVPPDLLVYFGDLSWRSSGLVGTKSLHVFDDEDTRPDEANHAPEGLYVLVADGVHPDAGEERGLRDVAPTLLTLLGEPVPGDMEGVSLV